MNIENLDSTSERLSDDATTLERLEKFTKIANILRSEGIYLKSLDNGSPQLEDPKCGYVLTHNIITWEIFKAKDVAQMIIDGRNNYKNELSTVQA